MCTDATTRWIACRFGRTAVGDVYGGSGAQHPPSSGALRHGEDTGGWTLAAWKTGMAALAR